MSLEIRKDYFLEKYVIVTPSRSKRPRGVKSVEHASDNGENCPFCPGKIEKNLILKKYPPLLKNDPWSAVVIENKYPIVTLDSDKAYGQHEVIIETPKHNKEFSELSIKEISNILNVFKHRTEVLSQIPKINYILIFKNEGGKAGASLPHTHCQVFATDFLPPDLKEESIVVKKYQKENHQCPYCEIIKKEEKGPRHVYADEKIVAFCPYASSYHYETWIFPKRHIDNINNLSREEITSFAKAIKKVLKKIDELNIPYNFFLHQVISDPDQHFYLKIQPREAVWGGVELGSGLIVNSLSPEEAAKFLRK